MSATRKTTGKKLKAVQTFALYGSTAAGATGIILDIGGVCIPIPSALKIAISAIVGAIFGCCGGCNDYHQPDPAEQTHNDLAEIKHELDEVRDDILRHHKDDKHEPIELTDFREQKSRAGRTPGSVLFFQQSAAELDEVLAESYQYNATLFDSRADSPVHMEMESGPGDEKKSVTPLKRKSSFRM